jgi:3-oxoacyl-[acyl-carrier-protein] synthase-1
MNSSSAVCITGAGAVCAAGRTIEAIWDAIISGRSAIAEITRWDISNWPARHAAEVTDVDNRTLVEDRKLHKLISRTDLFGLYAADMAIKQSGLTAYRDGLAPEAAAIFNDRCGVFAGSGGGNYQNNYDFFPLLTTANGSLETFGRELQGTVNPMWLLRNLPNNVLCHIGIRHNFKGTNACITHQCVGGALAVAEAAAALRAREADQAVAVGHDTPLEPETVLHYHLLGLMTEDTLRPFDAARSGTVFGEGAAAVVLETGSQAEARNAKILGKFLGSGCATEALGIVDVRPDGDGLERAIRGALQEAGLSADAVGLIVAHGNGTPASDASEAAAIHRVFGSNPPPVTAFKWAFGHLIAASGTLDLVLALRALELGIVPGVANFRTADPDLPTLPISAAQQKPRSNVGLVLSRGFGAMNVALLACADEN